MSLGHTIYSDINNKDSNLNRIDYFIERKYKTTLVEGVSLRMCVATEIVRFDELNRHKEIIRFDTEGKVKERVVYTWEDKVNTVDLYDFAEHTSRRIYEYDQNGRLYKKEWYDLENGNLIYRGTETTEYDNSGNEIYKAWINSKRNYNCWKWISEFSDNGRNIKKSYYRGSQLDDFSHTLLFKNDENGNVIEKRIIHCKRAIHSNDSIELNKFEDGKILSHVAKYVFPDGRETTYEEDLYFYEDNRLAKIQHINNRETQYFYNQSGLLYLELYLKDGKVTSIINYFYDNLNNETLKVWNSISDNERITYESRYDDNGNKIYEKRITETLKSIEIIEWEWDFIYRKSVH